MIGLVRTVAVLAALWILAEFQARATQESLRLLRQSDLVYQGAFRLPSGAVGTSSFAYGGTALAFNAARRSLFLVGHDWHQQVAEVSIPDPRTAMEPAGLAVATVLQPFSDATEGTMGRVGEGNVKVGGLLPYQGRLFQTAYLYYDAAGTQTMSHFVSGMDLTVKGDVTGPFRVGKLGAGFVSGYFAEIPAAWRASLGGPVLNGNCCLGIISRTSYGPAAFAIDPLDIGTKDPVPATPLLYYAAAHPLLEPGAEGDGWGNTSRLFNGTTEVTGVVFPEGASSVLFFGRQGVGTFCYGPGTTDRTKAGQLVEGGPDRFCYDPADSAKGVHAYPYKSFVWAYDASDLSAARARRKAPWEVRPYATWELTVPFPHGTARLKGAAYDGLAQRIFVSQAFGDGELPLIHVFGIAAR